MAEPLSLETLQRAVSGTAAAFRCRRTLHPAGGPGDKVFPPTYAGAVYAVEERRVRDASGQEQVVPCVLLDAVQSSANRMEEALQDAVDAGEIPLPLLEVRFPDDQLLQPVGRVTSLQAPHRSADAILRDSLLDGVPFAQSEIGLRLSRCTLQHATALYEYCPTALVFGLWDSTGPRGGLGAKFARVLVSEIVGVNASFGTRTSSRIDPLGIQLKAGPVYRTAEGKGPLPWTLDESSAATKGKAPEKIKDGKPSQVNHGNITPSLSAVDRETGRPLAGGVTISHAEQSIVLSLPGLRRFRFPDATGSRTGERDAAARTVLAALGLCASTLAMDKGLDLRSRCLLWPEAPAEWELLDVPGSPATRYTLNHDQAVALLRQAVAAAQKHGLTWAGTVSLSASEPMVQLVRKSQELTVSQGGEEEA